MIEFLNSVFRDPELCWAKPNDEPLVAPLSASAVVHRKTEFLISKVKSVRDPHIVAAETMIVDRPLTKHEVAIAKGLLLHATPPATDFLPQLDVARVSGHCSCGCPAADLKVPEDHPKAEVRDNPIGDAIGEVDGKMVGVMLMQRGGYLKCLEIYDLSGIEHPYGLPDVSSLRPFEAGM